MSPQESKSLKRRHRPASLLIPKPEELEQILTLDERKAAHAAIIRSSSVDDGNLKVRSKNTRLCAVELAKEGVPS